MSPIKIIKQSHNIFTILYEMMKVLYFRAKPDEFVMDMEAGEIKTVLEIFNSLMLKKYLEQAFAYLSGLSSKLYHVLVAQYHIVKLLTQTFKHSESLIYLRSLSLLIDEHSMRNVIDIFTCLMFISKCKYKFKLLDGCTLERFI